MNTIRMSCYIRYVAYIAGLEDSEFECWIKGDDCVMFTSESNV